jgi:hypothetical protein
VDWAPWKESITTARSKMKKDLIFLNSIAKILYRTIFLLDLNGKENI